MRSIVWLSWVAGAVVMAGCLGSPAERTCADFPRDTPECADYWAGEGDAGAPDGAMDRGVVADAGDEDAAADAVVDAAADAVVDAAADAAADAGGACTPGAVEACAADGFCEGRRVCGEDRVWSACVPGDPVDEACNGRDDDCDGEVDELVDRPCGIDTGACSAGVERCAEGRWLCEGAVAPAEAEACDGAVDEDCDGSVDEGCPCTEGTVEPCGESAVGACALGERACTAAGWGACVGAVGPGAEGCNGEDDDCDGVIDEGLARACGSAVGACAEGEQVCAEGAWGACAGEVGPAAEGCDGVDEDCDGAVDEGVAVACGSDVGICAAGVRRCVDGALGVCDAAVLPGAQAEACRAGAEDEDCDGSVDEGCGCINGETRACGLAVGRCRAGMQTCAGGMWGGCIGAVPPAAETCDGSDEDCDGATDEGFDVGAACSAGVGLCRRDGARVCSGGVGVCGVMPGPAAEESCDGLDQDCDGRVDEGLPPFVTSELRIGAGVATVGPVVAAVGGQYAVARVERLGLDIGLPGGRRGVGVAFNAYDVRGRPVAADVMLASDLNAVAALAMTAFDNAGDAGYAVFFATTSRDVGVDGDGYTISAVVVFPGRMAEVSEVLPLVTLPNAVTSLGAAASDRGIGLTWATASIEPRVGFGFIDFRVEPPMLAPVNVTQSADGATIAWDGTRFVVGWRASMPLLRGAAIRLAAIDGNRPGPAVTLVEAESVGVPRLVAGGGQVHAVWHAEGRVGAPQVFVGSAEMARGTVSRPVAVSPDGLPALDPAIAYGAAGVGVAWVDAREGEDETEVYFRRLSGGVQRGWQVVGEPIVVSRGVGVSGPVDAAAGSAFAVTWYDARPESPGVYLSTGPLGCVPAAIQ